MASHLLGIGNTSMALVMLIVLLVQSAPSNAGKKKVCAVVQPEHREREWVITEGQSESWLADYWNDNIGYVHLSRGCYLSVYHDMNYEGTHQYLFHKKDKNIIAKSGGKDYPIDNNGWIGHWWSNDISSFRCYC